LGPVKNFGQSRLADSVSTCQGGQRHRAFALFSPFENNVRNQNF
jgi:hypothetical protein